MAAQAKLEDEIVAFTRRTKAEAKAEERLDFRAVALIGYERAVPRAFGDNQGMWPCRLVITKTPRTVHKKPDTEQPFHPIKLIAYIWTKSEAHAERLKDRMEALFYGQNEESRILRRTWMNVHEPKAMWDQILPWAHYEINKREELDLWTEQEYRALVQRVMGGGIK